jgi:SUKH-4 immunity protein
MKDAVMEPEMFKKRFIQALPDLPPDLDLRLDEFVLFPETEVEVLQIPKDDKLILTASGLPKDAAPFLSFGSSRGVFLRRMSAFGLPKDFDRFRTIGFNSSGDMICLDEGDGGRVVYLNHDDNMKVVYMNSGIRSLALSLCLYGEFMLNREADVCRAAIRKVDPKAVEPGSFWASEIESKENM